MERTMSKTGFLERMKGVFAEMTGKNKFDKLDFGILKTMLMLTAVDGDIAKDEVAQFKSMAEQCRGYNGESFESLWDSALRSAGYLLIQARFLDRAGLVEAFVKEAEQSFTGEVAQEISKERERAFASLEAMAKADGDYSDIERDCISALVKRVKVVRDQVIAARYPRAVLHS